MEISDPPATGAKRVNRREFLSYIWAASAALLFAESSAGVMAYMIWRPLRKSLLHIDLSTIDMASFKDTTVNKPVYQQPRIWLSNTPAGLFALYDCCPYCGCMLKWISVDNRFECFCLGAAFQADGTLIVGHGPGRHNLDSYQVTVKTPDGTRTTPPQGGPVDLTGAIAIDVDLEAPITGWPIGYSASGKPPTQSD